MHHPIMPLLPISAFLFLAGTIFFIIWLARYTDKKTQLKWIIGFLIVGILGLITGCILMNKMQGEWKEQAGKNTPYSKDYPMKGYDKPYGKKQGMMEEMHMGSGARLAK